MLGQSRNLFPRIMWCCRSVQVNVDVDILYSKVHVCSLREIQLQIHALLFINCLVCFNLRLGPSHPTYERLCLVRVVIIVRPALHLPVVYQLKFYKYSLRQHKITRGKLHFAMWKYFIVNIVYRSDKITGTINKVYDAFISLNNL